MREPADERPSWRQHDSPRSSTAERRTTCNIFPGREIFKRCDSRALKCLPSLGAEVRLLLHTTEERYTGIVTSAFLGMYFS